MAKGCPIVAVSMDERLDGLMKELSVEKDFLLHVDDEDLGRKLFGMLRAAWPQREAEFVNGCEPVTAKPACNKFVAVNRKPGCKTPFQEEIRRSILLYEEEQRRELARMGEFMGHYLKKELECKAAGSGKAAKHPSGNR